MISHCPRVWPGCVLGPWSALCSVIFHYLIPLLFLKNHWTMILHHVCGDHDLSHPDGSADVLSLCLHGELSDEQLRKDRSRQLKLDEQGLRRSAGVFSQKNMTRIDGVLSFRHPRSIKKENDHSVSLGYTPKRVYFELVKSPSGMTML